MALATTISDRTSASRPDLGELGPEFRPGVSDFAIAAARH
jgi:hypothetical protein